MTWRPVIHPQSKYWLPLSAVLIRSDVWPRVSARVKSNTGAIYSQRVGTFTPEDTVDGPHGSVALPGPLASVRAHHSQRQVRAARTTTNNITWTCRHFEVCSIATLSPSDPAWLQRTCCQSYQWAAVSWNAAYVILSLIGLVSWRAPPPSDLMTCFCFCFF